MKRIITIVALAALAACDSATGSDVARTTPADIHAAKSPDRVARTTQADIYGPSDPPIVNMNSGAITPVKSSQPQ